MTNPKITRRQMIKGAAAVGAFGAVGLPSIAFAEGGEDCTRLPQLQPQLHPFVG